MSMKPGATRQTTTAQDRQVKGARNRPGGVAPAKDRPAQKPKDRDR